MGAEDPIIKEQFCMGDLVVDKRDITTVYEALKKCNPSILLETMMDSEAGWCQRVSQLSSTVKEALISKIRSSLSLMHEMEPLIPTVPEEMIIPWQEFQRIGPDGQFKRSLSARILNCKMMCDEADSLFAPDSYLYSLSEMRERASQGNPFFTLEAERPILSIDQLIGEPWPFVLGRLIWLPHSLCAREHYAVLSSVFWAMTYWGYGFDASTPPIASLLYEPCLDAVPPTFFGEYEGKMDLFVDLLNFDHLVDVVTAARRLCALQTPE